jgi:hypothetical protein
MNHDRTGGITHDLGFKFGNAAALEWRPLAGTGWVTALAVNADDQIVMGAVTLGVVVDPTAGTVGIGDVDGGAVVIEVEADGDVQIGDQTGDLVIDIDDAGNLGFFATTPAVGQQTLTASGDAARLTEVIGALENLGLVVDSTTPGASSGTPFTVTTVTEGVAVELAMTVDLPAAPSEGDECAVGMVVDAVVARQGTAVEAYSVTFWAAFVFTYSSSAWTCSATGALGRTFTMGAPDAYPSGSVFSVSYGSSLPEARTTAPLEFTTTDDTDGPFIVKGTYRQIERIEFEAPS